MSPALISRFALLIYLFSVGHLPAVEWIKHTIVSGATSGVPSAVACDVDGDGVKDVITSYDGQVVLLRGPTWASIPIHQFAVGNAIKKGSKSNIHSALMDVDGDGDLDYLGANQLIYWLECPKKPLTEPWTYRVVEDQMRGIHCLTVADIDGDGKMDLVANSFAHEGTSLPDSIMWYSVPTPGDPAAKWARHIFADKDAPGGSHYMAVGDLNGDGRVDISVGAKGGDEFPGGPYFAWWEQPLDAKLAWKKHMLTKTRAGATHANPVDVDGDGIMDIIASCGHAQGVLWFKGPDFTIRDIDATANYPHALATADFDGDGDIDAAICGSKADGLLIWYANDGKGNFKRFVIDPKQSSYDLRAIDMDGDGDLDLLNAGQASKNVVWYENR
jgi:FG-GAP-like repeat